PGMFWGVLVSILDSCLAAALFTMIAIPGVMTGWVLGGADVLQVARYQQIILFMITASTASSVLLAVVLYCGYMLVDGRPMLYTDRIERTERAKAVAGATPLR
ncbi:hypothetical protein H4R19_004412, partial [Coemansia spiralis]